MGRERYATDIERIMLEALKSLDLEVVEQFPIRSKYGYIVDFYLPKYNIIIEADGEHWHNETHDRKRDGFLRKCGYKILRFKGNEIKNHIKECLTKIRQELKSISVIR